MKQLLTDIPGIGPGTARLLAEHGIDSIKALKKAGIKGLTALPGFGESRAGAVLNAVESLQQEKQEKPAKEKKAKGDKVKKEKADKKKKKSKKSKDGKSKKGKADKKKRGKKKKK